MSLEKFVTDKVGLFTLADIKQELLKPGRDPRDKFVVPTFRDDVKEVGDLKLEMVLEGSVTNVTNFGAFVDIGVHQDGLVHVSEISNRFIQDPREAVHVGEIVKVKVIGVDVGLKRISLSMKALLPERKRSKLEGKALTRTEKPHQVPDQQKAALPRADGKPTKKPFTRPKPQPVNRGRSSKPDSSKPVTKPPSPQADERPSKVAEVKPAQKQAPRTVPVKKTEPVPQQVLSFEEKIRLLQQKFGGIR